MDTELERLLDAYTRLCLDIVERERARDAVKQQISNLFITNGQPQKPTADDTTLVFTGHSPSILVASGGRRKTPSLVEALAANPDTSATELTSAANLNYSACVVALNKLLAEGKVTVDKSRMPYRWRLA